MRLYFFMFKSLHIQWELMHFEFLLCFSLQGTRESINNKKKSHRSWFQNSRAIMYKLSTQSFHLESVFYLKKME